jgi:DNA repair exonuclease SbcCD ATPase subunit
MGREYRSLIKMDADQGKQEGYLWIDGKSVVNGKITPYKEKVNEIFGQPFTYFRSQFCPQKSKNTQGMQIENMTAGVFRELLQQFLNLQRYAAWEDTAKQAGNILSSQLARYDSDLEALKKRIGEAQATREELGRLNVSLSEQIANKSALGEKLTAAQKEREGLKETIARNEVLAAQITDLKKTLDEMKVGKVREESASGEQLQKLREAYQKIAQEIKAADEILASEAAIFAAAENEKSCKELIDSLAEDIDLIADNITEESAVMAAHEKEIQGLNHSLPVPSKDERIAAINGEIRTLAQQIDGYKSQLKTLDVRDQECTSNSCSFIVAALKAKDELPAAEDRLAQLQVEKEARLSELNAIGIEILQQITAKEELLKASRARLTEHQDIQSAKRKVLATKRLEINQYKNMAEKQSALAVAKSKKEDRTKDLEENKKQGVAISAEWTARKTILDDQIVSRHEAIHEIDMRIDESANSKVQEIERDIATIEHGINMDNTLINQNEKQIAALQSDLTRAEAAEKELETVKSQRESLVGKISRWRYLQIGCGKTGLQNLRIDGAAPRIIYNANKLLSQAYGARYSVRLETQNEDGKEDLQIKIIMENGQEVYLDDISGGQRAWNVQALWLAMSLLNQERSGRKYDYFCSDESDGALDVENAVKYTALYRPFMEEGRLDRLVFISHKEQCRSIADHVLMFEAGKNPYWN